MRKTATLMLIHGAIEFVIVVAILIACGPVLSALTLKAIKVITAKGIFSTAIGSIIALKSIL